MPETSARGMQTISRFQADLDRLLAEGISCRPIAVSDSIIERKENVWLSAKKRSLTHCFGLPSRGVREPWLPLWAICSPRFRYSLHRAREARTNPGEF